MYIVDSCTYYIFTHLLYVSYVLQILCLLRYSSLRYPVTYPILITIEKMYSQAFHTSNSLRPRWNLPCHDEGAYPPRSFTHVSQRGEVNWASQLQPSGQQISSILIQFANICDSAAAERLPSLARRKLAMSRASTVSFIESFKSCISFFVALPGLINTQLFSC